MLFMLSFHQGNVTKRKYCPVGKLLPGVHVVIMDENLQPQPVSVAGEVKLNITYFPVISWFLKKC